MRLSSSSAPLKTKRSEAERNLLRSACTAVSPPPSTRALKYINITWSALLSQYFLWGHLRSSKNRWLIKHPDASTTEYHSRTSLRKTPSTEPSDKQNPLHEDDVNVLRRAAERLQKFIESNTDLKSMERHNLHNAGCVSRAAIAKLFWKLRKTDESARLAPMHLHLPLARERERPMLPVFGNRRRLEKSLTRSYSKGVKGHCISTSTAMRRHEASITAQPKDKGRCWPIPFWVSHTHHF